MLLSDRLQMLLHDDVIDVQNDEAFENKIKIKIKIKIRFTYSVLACAETSFARESHLYE